jgi:hypothetical protein
MADHNIAVRQEGEDFICVPKETFVAAGDTVLWQGVTDIEIEYAKSPFAGPLRFKLTNQSLVRPGLKKNEKFQPSRAFVNGQPRRFAGDIIIKEDG